MIDQDSYRPTYHENGYDHKPRPVVIKEKVINFINAGWGLIPQWTENAEKAKWMETHLLNAKSETIFELKSFRESILERRCLIPSTGFYDSQEVRNKSYPYRVYLKHEEIFCLAGIWDEWKDPETGDIKRTYSMLTTPPNKKFSQIHHRMPLILPRELEEIWIDPSLQNQKEIEPLLQIYPEDHMDFYTTRRFKKGDEFDPSILNRYEYAELSQQELF
nr:SOS response-associated peptidase [Leptospira kmetyi]